MFRRLLCIECETSPCFICLKYSFQIYPEVTAVFNPTMVELTRAIVTLVGESMAQNAFLVCQNSLLTDGFFNEQISNRLG